MGCASSKPSSSSKNKKKDSSSNTNNKAAAGKSKQPNKSTDATNGKVVKSATTGSSELDELIKIDKKLLSQIDQHRDDVVAYIVNLVRRDLNAELVSNGGSQHSKGNMAALASAALSAPDNDSLITEASAKAISLIKGGKCETYRNLADSLKSSTFLCKNQTHKPRICELTADTIRRCLNDIYSQPSRPSGDFNLLAYLQAHQNGGVGENQLTPPATPQKIDSQKVTSASGEPGSPNEFNDSILLSRAEANKVARILFLTNRARPVIHASQRKRGAYFVNIQQDDNSEVPATRAQIEEIISPSAANRHQEQPSIYEVAETFLNNSEVALKLSPLWQSSSVSTPTHRLSTSPPVSPVQGIQGHPQVASSFDTPETPVVAGRRLKVEEEVELVVEQQVQQTSSTPITLSSPSEEEATTNENDVAAAANETIETDPAAGDGDESDARIQLGAAANLIMLANSLQNAQLDEQQADQDATVPVDEIVVDAENTSNDQIIVEETTTTRQNAEDQEPSSTSESTNLDQNNNAEDKEEAAIIKQQAPEASESSSKEAEPSASENLGDLKIVEAAATTIQATFRGYKTRKQFKTTGKSGSSENAMNNEVTEVTAAADEQLREQQDVEISHSTTNDRPATPVLGGDNTNNNHDNNNNNTNGGGENDAQVEASGSPTSEDLNGGDELREEQAVVKIQATYRGFRARKELKTVDQTNQTINKSPELPPLQPEPQSEPLQQGTTTTTF